jgi:hypothetical protein
VQGFIPLEAKQRDADWSKKGYVIHEPSTRFNLNKRSVSKRGPIRSLPGQRQFQSVWAKCDDCDINGYVTKDFRNLQEAYAYNDVYDAIKAREREVIDGQAQDESADGRGEEVGDKIS